MLFENNELKHLQDFTLTKKKKKVIAKIVTE